MQSKTQRNSESGFSLVELCIVMIVMTIIMGAVFTLMKSSLNISNATYELTDTRDNLRIAHEYINRDLVNAGYGLNDYDKIIVPRVFVTDYLAKNVSPTNDPANTFGVDYMNLGLVWSDSDPGTVPVKDTSPAVTTLDNTDRITILRMDDSFTEISLPVGSITGSGATITMPTNPDGNRLKAGEFYFLTSASATAFGRIISITASGTNSLVNFSSIGSYGLNKPAIDGPINVVGAGGAAGISTKIVNMRRAYISHYYVNSKNQLMKREFGVAGSAAGFTDNLIAEHITGLSFRYILGKNNANGTVQQPVSQLTSWAQQDAVRQIEVKITGETTHQTNFLKSTHAQDTMTSISSARNLQFRRAQQPKVP
jgi:type II secretory pathway pseudopilin PulG